MFKSIELKCFRKHEDLTINFEHGLVAIRGLNEAGKSTLQEALAYALFGSSALRQPFAEVVTWGKAEGDLRVRLTLDDGTFITRSKRGAEIANTGVLCTGQRECTAFMEAKLGASAETATKLMLASQNALRGALEGGPAEASALIESLADINLIDRVINAIQSELPTGNTLAVEANVKRWTEHLESIKVIQPDLSAEEAEIARLTEAGVENAETRKMLAKDLAGIDVAGARAHMIALAELIREEASLAPEIVRTEEAANVTLTNPNVDEQLNTWRAELMGLKDRVAACEAYRAVHALAEPELMWEGSTDGFRAEMDRLRRLYDSTLNDKHALEIRKVNAVSKRINETACAFCGKDLTEVPEVVLRNTASDNEVRVISEKILINGVTLAGVSEQIAEMHTLDRAANDYETKVNRFSRYLKLHADRYPLRWEWVGDQPIDPRGVDFNALIREAEQLQTLYQRQLGARDAARARLVDLRAKAATLQGKRIDLEMSQVEMAEKIRIGGELEIQVAQLDVAIHNDSSQLRELKQMVQQAHATTLRQEEQYNLAKGQLDQANADLKGMNFNNALIKRVRAARPVISDKLWSVVLASVSQHFSQIRGVQSIITREASGFRCDGQAVQGLSGSTLDALGLAIRIALTKTFLPNSRFMLLDEPGAAADDDREANMLGLLAASDFDQILLITHSALADTFAAQVIAL